MDGQWPEACGMGGLCGRQFVIEADGNATILNSYVEMARAYPIFQKDSVVSQKISAATSGCVVQVPMLITRVTGV